MMESMTEDHKGIFVESMRRNDVFLFFNQVGEAREARESEQKIKIENNWQQPKNKLLSQRAACFRNVP